MSAPPPQMLAILSRTRLTEMLAPTYGAARNIDVNEAYTRLETALRDLSLIHSLQSTTWQALQEAEPSLSREDLIAKVDKKLSKRRAFKAAKTSRKDEGALTALTVRFDVGAGVSSGEAWDLLESTEGQALLARGVALAGKHLAAELLR